MTDGPGQSHWSLAEIWRFDQARLRRRLRDDPLDEHAWLWRVRLRVLEFMARRYGGASAAASSSEPPDGIELGPLADVPGTFSVGPSPYVREPMEWHGWAHDRAARHLRDIAATLEGHVAPQPEPSPPRRSDVDVTFAWLVGVGAALVAVGVLLAPSLFVAVASTSSWVGGFVGGFVMVPVGMVFMLAGLVRVLIK